MLGFGRRETAVETTPLAEKNSESRHVVTGLRNRRREYVRLLALRDQKHKEREERKEGQKKLESAMRQVRYSQTLSKLLTFEGCSTNNGIVMVQLTSGDNWDLIDAIARLAELGEPTYIVVDFSQAPELRKDYFSKIFSLKLLLRKSNGSLQFCNLPTREQQELEDLKIADRVSNHMDIETALEAMQKTRAERKGNEPNV